MVQFGSAALYPWTWRTASAEGRGRDGAELCFGPRARGAGARGLRWLGARLEIRAGSRARDRVFGVKVSGVVRGCAVMVANQRAGRDERGSRR